MIGQITDAAEAHAADIEESANMYSYLIGGSVAKKKSRPRTAGANSNRQGVKNLVSHATRPTTASSSSIVRHRSGASKPNANVYDYPKVEQKSDKEKTIEQEQWLEERWLKGRSDEAADRV